MIASGPLRRALAAVLAAILPSIGSGFALSSAPNPAPADFFSDRVAPVLDRRCVACHSCLEAPCQLKIGAYAGLARGIKREYVLGLDGPSVPTRLIDEATVVGWRRRGYSPVVPEAENRASASARWSESILYRAIAQGRSRPFAALDQPLLEAYYQKSDLFCPASASAYAAFASARPHMGMPLGLPPLNDAETWAIGKWIGDGAPGPSPARRAYELIPAQPAVVAQWESFLNGADPRERLVARYLFEHLSFARLHFAGSPEREFFELARSRAAPGLPIDEVVSDTPNSDPGALPFYYRLRKAVEAPVLKTHIAWNVDAGELARLKQLFFGAPWPLPASYRDKRSGNPFVDFDAIPAAARSLFMLAHSRVLIDQMTRGSVCTETTGTYAIRDHFWVMFLDPAADPSVQSPYLGSGGPIGNGLLTENAYLNEFESRLRELRPGGLSLADVWQGYQGDASGARITVMRHESTASVYNGWIGGPTPTAWMLSYSNFERLFYNLVVNYRFWGSRFHKAATWLIMSDIRKEGEELFLSLVPAELREGVRERFTRGVEVGAYMTFAQRSIGRDSRLEVRDKQAPYEDVLGQVARAFGAHGPEPGDDLNYRRLGQAPQPPVRVASLADFEDGIRLVAQRRDLRFPRHMPSIAYLRMLDPASGRYEAYSLINHRAYSGNENPILRERRRRGEEDYFSAFRGIYGSHPQLFFDLDAASAPAFFRALLAVSSQGGVRDLLARFGIERWNPGFWPFYDWLLKYHRQVDPLNAGIIDLNEYQNGLGYE